VGCGVLVSRMATFRPSIGWRAWACMALTCAYAPGRDVHESGSSLKVAHSDTTLRLEAQGETACACIWESGAAG